MNSQGLISRWSKVARTIPKRTRGRVAAGLSMALALVAAAPSALAQPAPQNPWLARSTWPIFHQSTYAQASGPFDAPTGAAPVRVQRLDTPEGGVSPWTVVGETYPDGSQAAYGTIQSGVVKWLIDGDRFEQISYTPLPRGRLDFDWNIAVLRTGEVIVTSKQDNRFILLADREANCPRCPLRITRSISVPQSVGPLSTHFSISHDGHILALLENGRIAAISLTSGDVTDTYNLNIEGSDYGQHNAFAIDETGRVFVASQETMTALDWNGRAFALAWRAAYDFRGPGCQSERPTRRAREILRVARGQRCTGSGTTPTLIGTAEDGVVVLVDGHAPANNLVAFWRNAIPADWRPLAGRDVRVASVLPLPLSTPEGEGFTAENSPAAVGEAIFIAQWAGFRPDCTPPRGVQRVDWRSDRRRLELVWANPDVHFNGVPTASSATGLVYGAGRGAGCSYAYRGLDIETGALRLDVPLGEENDFLDQGNQQTITADGSILVAVRRGIRRLVEAN